MLVLGDSDTPRAILVYPNRNDAVDYLHIELLLELVYLGGHFSKQMFYLFIVGSLGTLTGQIKPLNKLGLH